MSELPAEMRNVRLEQQADEILSQLDAIFYEKLNEELERARRMGDMALLEAAASNRD